MALIRTERGLDRLVNFSDATVAIAITLLILPLVDEASHLGDHTLAEFLDANWWQLLAFLISFAVIARFWVIHHRIFESVVSYSGPLLWCNFLWLLSIVAIPFTANLLSNSRGERPEVYAVYIGDLFLAILATQLIGIVLYRTPSLITEEARRDVDRTRGIAELILIAVALVLAVLVPVVGMYWLFLLFLAGPVHALLRRVFHGSSAEVG